MEKLPLPNAHVKPDNGETVVWYEFLLNPDQLPTHLSGDDPDPSGTALIKKFFEQANKPVNDQGQILPPPENKRNALLRSLALQTGAILKWNLDLFEKELPISTRHQLLRELLAKCNASSFPARTSDITSQINAMHDHTIMAIVLYCRWAARTVVKSAFPVKPSGRITPTVPPPGFYQANAQQRCDELREQIIGIVKDQCFDIVQFLEAFLQYIKRPVHVPDYDGMKNNQLCSSDNLVGWKVSFEELHAQVCYDLGCLHFMHGFYDKAFEMFGHTQEWLKCLIEATSGYCDIDRVALNGYLVACKSITPQQGNRAKDPETENLYEEVNDCLKDRKRIRELGEKLMDDIKVNELSMAFRDHLEQRLLYDDIDSCNVDLHFDVVWSNAICRAVRGHTQPTCLWTYDLNVAQLQKILGFVQQCYSFVPRKGRKKLGAFLHSLYNNVSNPGLQEQLLHCETAQHCLSAEELQEMKQSSEALEKDSSIVQDSPASPEMTPTGAALMTDLEAKLITSFDPKILKETMTTMHTISPDSQNWKICDLWKINPEYETILKSISVAVSKDLMYVLLAKVNHCFAERDSYTTAKTLLSYIQEHGKSLSFKLHKIASYEMLKVELLELINDPSLTFSRESECQELREQLSDILKRVRQHLSKPSDVVIAPSDLNALCIAMLVNLEDYSFFDSVSSKSSNGHLVFAKQVSKVHSRYASCKHLSDVKKTAGDLWHSVSDIFAASIYHLRRSQDNAAIINKIQDVPSSLITRPEFLSLIKKIRNGNVLNIIVSLLVRLHRICQEDILAEIKVNLSDLWPSSLSGKPHSISAPCLSNAMKEVLEHCLTLQPHNANWLRTQADIDFAYCNYPSAFRGYLKLGAVKSNFYSKEQINALMFDNLLINRMVKCCMQMKCNTQAAVLCQMMKEIDYSAAFKALQENRERADAMEVHYREHFWDVELLEHATCMHRYSGEGAKKESALRALADPDINLCNNPNVLANVSNTRNQRFFRTLARQFLC